MKKIFYTLLLFPLICCGMNNNNNIVPLSTSPQNTFWLNPLGVYNKHISVNYGYGKFWMFNIPINIDKNDPKFIQERDETLNLINEFRAALDNKNFSYLNSNTKTLVDRIGNRIKHLAAVICILQSPDTGLSNENRLTYFSHIKQNFSDFITPLSKIIINEEMNKITNTLSSQVKEVNNLFESINNNQDIFNMDEEL